ncbi:MAG: PEP/pyruvate-binding domain-containing protein, partial [Candidatus Woesearchaeota archaeon]|nr:PEP/pyruvate-binding domain-containing protein [Candidatus Woesearchaeota archaeon]
MNKKHALVLWFDEVGIEDVGLVGGKNASLGEMYQNLTKQGVRIPNGFAVTATAYRHFLEKNNADEQIKKALKGVDHTDVKALAKAGEACRHIISHC